jgi:uncharacterized protein involved in type VI secretion and phage assembly
MRCAIAVVTLAFAASAGAQVNKCFDRAGRVVGYGMQCPAGTRAEATAIRSAPAGSPGAAPKSLAERDADFRKRLIEQQELAQKSAQEASEARERRAACESARAYLKSLQAGHRIARTDSKTGQRVFLSDAEYPVEMASAQRAIAANCS